MAAPPSYADRAPRFEYCADNLGVGPALASIDVGHRIAQNAPGIVKMMARSNSLKYQNLWIGEDIVAMLFASEPIDLMPE